MATDDTTQYQDDPTPDQAPTMPDLSDLMMNRQAPQNPASYSPPPSNAPPRPGRARF